MNECLVLSFLAMPSLYCTSLFLFVHFLCYLFFFHAIFFSLYVVWVFLYTFVCFLMCLCLFCVNLICLTKVAAFVAFEHTIKKGATSKSAQHQYKDWMMWCLLFSRNTDASKSQSQSLKPNFSVFDALCSLFGAHFVLQGTKMWHTSCNPAQMTSYFFFNKSNYYNL